MAERETPDPELTPDLVEIPGAPDVHARQKPTKRMVEAGDPPDDFCLFCGDDWPCVDVRDHLASAPAPSGDDPGPGDDLVERLRERACERAEARARAIAVPDISDLLEGQAADEIDRLRAALAQSGERPDEPTVDDVPAVVCGECGDTADLPDLARRFLAFWARNHLAMSRDDARALALGERPDRPPTAGEVLAGLDRLQVWSFGTQSWCDSVIGDQAYMALRDADPSTPQPGLRLVAGPEVPDGAPRPAEGDER